MDVKTAYLQLGFYGKIPSERTEERGSQTGVLKERKGETHVYRSRRGGACATEKTMAQ